VSLQQRKLRSRILFAHSLSGTYHTAASCFHAKNGTRLHVLNGHSGSVDVLCASTLHHAKNVNTGVVISGSTDGTLRLWSPSTSSREAQQVFYGHVGAVVCLKVSPCCTRILSGSWDKQLILWSIDGLKRRGGRGRGGGERRVVKFRGPPHGHTSIVRSCDFSPCGTFAISGSDDTTVKIWNALNGQFVCTLRGHSQFVGAVVCSPLGDDDVIVSSAGKEIKIWDVKSRNCRQTLHHSGGDVAFCRFSPDGSSLVAAAFDGSVKIWA
jgi:WD40 repeat protein